MYKLHARFNVSVETCVPQPRRYCKHASLNAVGITGAGESNLSHMTSSELRNAC